MRFSIGTQSKPICKPEQTITFQTKKKSEYEIKSSNKEEIEKLKPST
jgi:hypothetical protein